MCRGICLGLSSYYISAFAAASNMQFLGENMQKLEATAPAPPSPCSFELPPSSSNQNFASFGFEQERLQLHVTISR